MLRIALGGVGLAVGAYGLLALAQGWPGGLGALILGVLLTVGTVFERIRYKQLQAKAPDARFQATAERFIDPKTGQPVTVYVDPATGERAYVKD